MRFLKSNDDESRSSSILVEIVFFGKPEIFQLLTTL